MFSELKQISMISDFIDIDHAKWLIMGINKCLADTLNAIIIDVLWGKEAELGGISLDPITSYDKTSRNGAKPDFIKDGDASNLWSYVYLNSGPAWVENVKKLDRTKPALNMASTDGQGYIDSKFLHFQLETDSLMAIPLTVRGHVRGIYCVELPVSGRLSFEALQLLLRLSEPIATVLWKADIRKVNDEQTRRVITEFTDSIVSYNFQDSLKPNKVGLISRPFSPDFDNVEAYIRRVLKDLGVFAEPYSYNPSGGYVIDDLMRQINSSQFGIADITGYNSNVMLELGMMMKVFNKKLLILRRKGDQIQLPFNLRPFHCYEYELKPGPDLRIWNPGNNQFESFEPKIKAFIDEIL